MLSILKQGNSIVYLVKHKHTPKEVKVNIFFLKKVQTYPLKSTFLCSIQNSDPIWFKFEAAFIPKQVSHLWPNKLDENQNTQKHPFFLYVWQSMKWRSSFCIINEKQQIKINILLAIFSPEYRLPIASSQQLPAKENHLKIQPKNLRK